MQYDAILEGETYKGQQYNPEKEYCTLVNKIPYLGKLFFERANVTCFIHDVDYITQDENRHDVDLRFYRGLRVNLNIFLSTIAYLAARIGGIWFWYRRKK